MARVTTVKKAQASKQPRTCFKCSHVIAPGESYFWWGVRTAMKRGYKRFACSEHRPTSRDMERSAFQLGLYDIEDIVNNAVDSFQGADHVPDISSLADAARDAGAKASELGEDCQNSLDNMPEGLQQGDTGQLLQERIEGCETMSQAFEDAGSQIDGIEQDILDPENWTEYAESEGIEREKTDCDVCTGQGTMEPAEDDDPHEEPEDCDTCKGLGHTLEDDQDFEDRVREKMLEVNQEKYDEAVEILQGVDTSI